MAINLNMDMGEVVKQVKAKLASRKAGHESRITNHAKKLPVREKTGSRSLKPYARVLALSGAVLGSVACYAFLHAMPLLEKQRQSEQRLMDLNQKREELTLLKNTERTLSKRVEEDGEAYGKLIAAFDDTADLDDLYQALSTLALVHQLRVEELNKQGTKAHAEFAGVQETTVKVSLVGRFHDYVTFKQSLSEDRPLLKVINEKLAVDTAARGADAGLLNVQLELATYTIDKEPFNAVLAQRH